MSEQKVVPLRLSAPSRQPARCRAALIDCVAGARRFGDDVYWLKENAELLNILQVTGAALPAGALRAYAGFYDQIADQLRFFRNITVSCCPFASISRIWVWIGNWGWRAIRARARPCAIGRRIRVWRMPNSAICNAPRPGG